MVHASLQAADLLAAKGIEVGVVNCRFVKPMDKALLLDLAGRNRTLVTVEENTIRGGFGSGVAETLSEAGVSAGRLVHLAIPDRFLEHASRAAVVDRAGLSPTRIAERVGELVGAA